MRQPAADTVTAGVGRETQQLQQQQHGV